MAVKSLLLETVSLNRLPTFSLSYSILLLELFLNQKNFVLEGEQWFRIISESFSVPQMKSLKKIFTKFRKKIRKGKLKLKGLHADQVFVTLLFWGKHSIVLEMGPNFLRYYIFDHVYGCFTLLWHSQGMVWIKKKIYDLVMICNVYVINFISNIHF